MGSPGPSGTANVVSHSITFAIDPGKVTIARLWCPSGQRALSGGYETGGTEDVKAFALIDAPLGDTNGGPATEGMVPIGWKVYIENPPGEPGRTGLLFAICTG